MKIWSVKSPYINTDMCHISLKRSKLAKYNKLICFTWRPNNEKAPESFFWIL